MILVNKFVLFKSMIHKLIIEDNCVTCMSLISLFIQVQEASENIDKGKGNGVGSKVKAKVVGIGRIS